MGFNDNSGRSGGGYRGGRPPNQPQSKPPGPPAISVAEAKQLREKVEALERLVREHFDEKNQWNSAVREWIGRGVKITLLIQASDPSHEVRGKLLWVDRYTMCVEVAREPVIVHKAAIATIRQD